MSGNESDSGSGDDNTFLPPQLLDADIEINANDSNDPSSENAKVKFNFPTTLDGFGYVFNGEIENVKK